ncbi:hypothetical protein XOCgx_4927 [Xanthomonas oryzae pv. oryzicola]|nr:hypothetical protein XOCgx_4927 [Xanthomonas oryzae pv. oryzicola]
MASGTASRTACGARGDTCHGSSETGTCLLKVSAGNGVPLANVTAVTSLSRSPPSRPL